MSTFSELIDFTRSSTGTYLDSVVYGDEALTGNWATAPSYNNVTTGTGTSVVSVLTGSGQNRCYLPIDNVEQGKSYITTITVDPASTASFGYYVRDGVNPNSGDLLISQTVVSGETYTLFCTATSDDMIVLLVGVSNSTMSASISVKEVTSTAGGTPLLRTADTNEPRLEYDVNGQPLGLLIEEQRTNLLSYSEAFDNAYWGKSGIATSPSGAVPPDGLGNAISLLAIGTSGAFVARSTLGTAGQGYTISVFAKAGTHDIIRITNQSSPTNGGWFDLTNGTTLTENGANNVSSIEYVGNGWYRCRRYFDNWIDANNAVLIGVCDADNSVASVVGHTVSLWGAQLEAGSFPTSYIPTSGSTVTRNKDVCTLPLERYHHNAQSYTMYAEFQSSPQVPSDFDRVWVLSNDDSPSDYVQLQYNTTNKMQVYSRYNSSGNGSISPIEVTDTTNKVALKVDGTVMRSASNGVLQSGTLSNAVEDFTKLTIGASDSISIPLNSHIKVIQSYAKGLTDAQLIDLTKPSSSPTMSLTFDGQATSELVEGLHD